MTSDDPSIEDNYINNLITIKIRVSVYLKNNIRLRGYLISHDDIGVFLKASGTQMIYKHRISTIEPETSFRNLF